MLFREKKYAWLLLALLWAIGFVGSLQRVVMAYFQPEIASSLGVGRSFLGFTWSLAVILGAVCAPVGGWLVDRFGYKRLMLVTSALGILSTATVFALRNPAGYFLGFGALAGLGGLGASISFVLVTQWFRVHRAKALAVLTSANSVGLAVLTPILVNLKGRVGWLSIVGFLAAAGCVSLALIAVAVRARPTDEESPAAPEPTTSPAVSVPATAPAKEGRGTSVAAAAGQRPSESRWRAAAQYAGHPTIRVVALALFACGISMGTVEMHLMAIHRAAHVPDAMLSTSLSLLGALEIAGGLAFSVLLDRLPKMKAVGALYLIRVAAFALLFLHLPSSPILFSLLFGATYVSAVPGGLLIAREAWSGQEGKTGLQTGLLLFLHQLGGAAAALGGGMDFDMTHSYQALIALDMTLSLLAGAGYFYAAARARTPAAGLQKSGAGAAN